MSKSADRRAARRTISWRNGQQNTARIARAIDNAVVCRTFVRSVLAVVTPAGGPIARIS